MPTPYQSNDGVIALVCGAVAMTTACFPFGFAGLYFGLRARRLAREAGDPGGSVATMGLIGALMGGIFGTIWLLFVLMYVVMIVFGVGLAMFGAAAGP